VQSLNAVFNSRIDALPVTFARITVGLLALARAIEGWRLGGRVLDPNTLKAPLIAGLTVPPEVLFIIIPAWAIAAVLFTLGLWLRISGAILTVCMFLTHGRAVMVQPSIPVSTRSAAAHDRQHDCAPERGECSGLACNSTQDTTEHCLHLRGSN
jgi:hypothetical protein